MRKAFVVVAVFAVAAGVASLRAAAQVPANQRALVTDPDLLAKMGFPRDARNVYIANGVLDARAPEAPADPDFYGPNTSFTGLAPKSFVGRQNSVAVPWEYTGGEEGCCVNLSRTGSETGVDAAVNLPEGVNLQFVRWWAVDTNAGADISFYLFESCYPTYAAGTTTITVLATSASTGSGGAQSGSAPVAGYTVNNRDCNLTQRVDFGATTGLTLQRVRYQWQRQVSPAPGVATFTDVPTTYWAFQYIEALKASGITGGVTPTTFQPESPVTRAQMAVFMAKALGLYWP